MGFTGRLSRWYCRVPMVLAVAGVVLLALGATVVGLAYLATGGLIALVASVVLYAGRPSHVQSSPVPRLPDGFVPPPAALTLPCAHLGAVPVDLILTGERVAWWCEACQTQLDAGFVSPPVRAVGSARDVSKGRPVVSGQWEHDESRRWWELVAYREDVPRQTMDRIVGATVTDEFIANVANPARTTAYLFNKIGSVPPPLAGYLPPPGDPNVVIYDLDEP